MIIGCAHCGYTQMTVDDTVSAGTVRFTTLNCKRCKQRSEHTVRIFEGVPGVVSRLLPRITVDAPVRSG